MIQVRSFEITDQDGINEALKTLPLAGNMHILISDGKVCIPFEDGLPPTIGQRIASLKEQIHSHKAQIEIIEHSQRVLDKELPVLRNAMSEATARREEISKINDRSKEIYNEMNELRTAIENGENQIKQKEVQYMMNANEIRLKKTNIEVFEETIAELEKNQNA